MSEAVTALAHARHEAVGLTVEELGPLGMITLRADLGAPWLEKALGQPAPDMRQVSDTEDQPICWMSPDELLIFCPYAAVADRLAALHDAMTGQHYMAVDVSDARAVFRLTGPDVRNVLSKLAPVDLAPGQFEPQMFRRTRLSQVAAAFWMLDETTVHLICNRSEAQYVFDLLKMSA